MAANNSNAQTRATRALDRILQRPKPALLGWQKSDTEIVISAPGGLGRVYITWPESGTRDTAVNRRGVPLAGRLPILVVPGFPNVIVDIDSSNMAAVAAALNNEYGTPAHPLSAHSDVLLTTLSNDEVLAWDATAGKWVNVAQAGALVTSVNSQTGAVVLDADDIDDSATTNKFATAAELADIASAVQPGDLATVATTGAYSDLSGTPTIPADTATAINAATEKVTLVDDDRVAGIDTEAADALTWWKWSTIKSTLTTLFNGLYGRLASTNTWTQVNTFSSKMYASDDIVLVLNKFIRAIDSGGAERSIFGTESSDNSVSFFNNLDGDGGPIRIRTKSGGAESARWDENGRFGVGVTTMQGLAHFHDGTGGDLFVTKTGVNGTAQTIIPDGAGDVLRHCYIIGVLWATDNSFSRSFAQGTANNSNFVIFVDSPTNANGITFTVSSAGALTIQRTSGSKTYTFAGKIIWL